MAADKNKIKEAMNFETFEKDTDIAQAIDRMSESIKSFGKAFEEFGKSYGEMSTKVARVSIVGYRTSMSWSEYTDVEFEVVEVGTRGRRRGIYHDVLGTPDYERNRQVLDMMKARPEEIFELERRHIDWLDQRPTLRYDEYASIRGVEFFKEYDSDPFYHLEAKDRKRKKIG